MQRSVVLQRRDVFGLKTAAVEAGDDQQIYPVLTEAERAKLHHYELKSLSDRTRISYESDLRAFIEFLKERDPRLVDCPERASWQHCLLFLTSMQEAGLAYTTIKKRFSFLKAHLLPCLKLPEYEAKYWKVLQGIQKEHDDRTKQKGKSPLTWDMVSQVLDEMDTPDGVENLQNRVLLLYMFHTAKRVSEVVVARWKHIVFSERGIKINIPFSKTGRNQIVAIERIAGEQEKFVDELKAWHDTIKPRPEDFVFRKVVDGSITDEPLSRYEITSMIKQQVFKIGLDPALYSCHSLRAGHVTTRYNAGVSIHEIMKRTRHRSVKTAMSYCKKSAKEWE